MSAIPIRAGQVWRHKKTGDKRFVLHAPTPGITNDYVVHKGRRRTESREDNFRIRYEFDHDSPEGTLE